MSGHALWSRRLAAVWSWGRGHSPSGRNHFLDCFKPNYRLWAAERGDELIGYAVVAYMADEAHLLNICVSPRVRGQGVSAGCYGI